MKPFSYYRNKHFLGELTMGDLIRFTKVEGEFSLGAHWLPIGRSVVSRAKRKVKVFMETGGDHPDLTISFDCRVKIAGNLVDLEGLGGDRFRLRLSEAPALLGMILEGLL
jgi:hypothetical protein